MQEGRRRCLEAAGPGVGVGVEDIGTPQWGRGWRGGWGRTAPGKWQEFLSFLDQYQFLFCRRLCSQEAPDRCSVGLRTESLLGCFCSPAFTLEPRDQTLGVSSLSTSYDDTVAAPSRVSCQIWWASSSTSLFFSNLVSLGAEWRNPWTETFDYLNKRSSQTELFQSSSNFWKIRLFPALWPYSYKWWYCWKNTSVTTGLRDFFLCPEKQLQCIFNGTKFYVDWFPS